MLNLYIPSAYAQDDEAPVVEPPAPVEEAPVEEDPADLEIETIEEAVETGIELHTEIQEGDWTAAIALGLAGIGAGSLRAWACGRSQRRSESWAAPGERGALLIVLVTRTVCLAGRDRDVALVAAIDPLAVLRPPRLGGQLQLRPGVAVRAHPVVVFDERELAAVSTMD